MSDKHPTVEEHLASWAAQMPGLRVTDAETQFIADIRRAAKAGVGYGWMQHIIEVEWNATSGGTAWGPVYFEKLIRKEKKSSPEPPEPPEPVEEEVCPTCHNPLKLYGCKHVESVGAFCRWPCICPFGVLSGDCSIHGRLVP